MTKINVDLKNQENLRQKILTTVQRLHVLLMPGSVDVIDNPVELQYILNFTNDSIDTPMELNMVLGEINNLRDDMKNNLSEEVLSEVNSLEKFIKEVIKEGCHLTPAPCTEPPKSAPTPSFPEICNGCDEPEEDDSFKFRKT